MNKLVAKEYINSVRSEHHLSLVEGFTLNILINQVLKRFILEGGDIDDGIIAYPERK